MMIAVLAVSNVIPLQDCAENARVFRDRRVQTGLDCLDVLNGQFVISVTARCLCDCCVERSIDGALSVLGVLR